MKIDPPSNESTDFLIQCETVGDILKNLLEKMIDFLTRDEDRL